MREDLEKTDVRCPKCLSLVIKIGHVAGTNIPIVKCNRCNKVYLELSPFHLLEIKISCLKYLAAKL